MTPGRDVVERVKDILADHRYSDKGPCKCADLIIAAVREADAALLRVRADELDARALDAHLTHLHRLRTAMQDKAAGSREAAALIEAQGKGEHE